MIKELDIVTIPTEKALGLPMLCIKKTPVIKVGTMGYCYNMDVFNINGVKYWEPLHIHIVSKTEKRNVGDYYLGNTILGKKVLLWTFELSKKYPDEKGKIISSTDKNLVRYDSRCTPKKYCIDLHCTCEMISKLPFIPESFVHHFIRSHNAKQPIKKIELDYFTREDFNQFTKNIYPEPTATELYELCNKYRINEDNSLAIN